jgi:hypothetical protein
MVKVERSFLRRIVEAFLFCVVGILMIPHVLYIVKSMYFESFGVWLF